MFHSTSYVTETFWIELIVETTVNDGDLAHPELGSWVTYCGPKPELSMFGTVLFAFVRIAGVSAVIAGWLVNPKPGSEALNLVLPAVGVSVLTLCAVSSVVSSVRATTQVDLFELGLLYRSQGREHVLRWGDFASVRILTVYDTRFSSYLMVRLTLADGETLEFDSRVEGRPEQIVAALSERVECVETDVLDLGS